MTAIEEIAAERRRQVKAEGWSEKHDDSHADGSLAMAAALYASPRDDLKVVSIGETSVVFADPWPWKDQYDDGGRTFSRWNAWDKRQKHDRRRRLIIAGALIAAEIERLDRLDVRIEKHLAPTAA